MLGLIALSFLTAGSQHSFMPENNLWMQDCIDCKANGMTQDLFDRIIDAGYKAFAPFARENKESLKINRLWTDSTVNANVRRYGGVVEINMYGGLARREEVNPAAFAIVLAHELGHAYGGTPYIRPASQMSAEGQADYFSTKEAFERMALLVLELSKNLDASFFVERHCDSEALCEQALEGGLALGSLLAVLSGDSAPQFETPDPLVVTVTELSYPATTQCRVDTYKAGWFHEERPKCWFFK